MYRRSAVIAVEVLIGLVGFVVLLTGLAFWRLSTGPVDLDFLTPEIEAALSDPDAGVTVKVGTTQLTWEEGRRTVDLHARNVYVRDGEGEVLALLPDVVLRLSLRALIQGTIAPTLVEVFDARLSVVRRADGTFQFGPWQEGAGAARPGELGGARAEGDLSSLVPEMIARLLAAPTPSEPLSFLNVVRIAGGRVAVNDRKLESIWTAPYADIELRRTAGGLAGEIVLKLHVDDRPASIFALLDYSEALRQIDLTTRFSDLVPQDIVSLAPGLSAVGGFSMPLAGSITASLSATGILRTLGFEIRGGSGQFQDDNFLAEPLPVRRVQATGTVDAQERRMTLESAVVRLGSDTDLGPRLTMTGTVTSAADGFRGDLAIQGRVTAEEIAVADLAAYWPAALVPNPRGWVLANITEGTADRATLNASLTMPDGKVSESVLHDLAGQLDYTALEVHYLRPLPPVTGVSGTAEFDDHRITFRPAAGEVGRLEVQEALVEITGLQAPRQAMNIDLPVVGPLPDALKLLDHDRLKLVRKLDLDPVSFSGAMATRVRFDFPLLAGLTFDDIKVAALANLEQVGAKALVFGQDVTDGSLKVALDAEGMQVTGPLVFADTPLEVSWSEAFAATRPERTRIEVQAPRVDARARSALGLSLAPYITGPLGADVTIRQDRAKTTIVDASLDLAGSLVEVPPLPWRKLPGAPATADLTAVLKDDRLVRIDGLDIDAGTLRAKGRAEFDADGESLKRLDFATLTMDETDLSEVTIDLADEVARLRLGRGVLDARPWLEGSPDAKAEPASGAPVPLVSPEATDSPPPEKVRRTSFRLSARDLDALIFGPDRYLEGVDIELRRSPQGWEKIQLNGAVPKSLWHSKAGRSGADLSGKIPKTLLLDYGPADGGGKTLFVKTPDMGAALRALNALDTVNGGSLEIVGTSEGPLPDAALKGRIDGNDYVLVGAPNLARLLTVASLTGLRDLLGGEGITFRRLIGEFTLEDGVMRSDLMRAYGPALGLTAKGEIDFDGNETDFEGTIVPAYTVNRVLGEIPLLGPLLTGGEGEGVFAATYEAKGPLGDLDVKVNLLSALAPGFLRSLFSGSSAGGEGFSALPPRMDR